MCVSVKWNFVDRAKLLLLSITAGQQAIIIISVFNFNNWWVEHSSNRTERTSFACWPKYSQT